MNQEPGGLNGGQRQGHNHSGGKNPFYGRHHTEASKAQISKSRVGSNWHKDYNIGCYSLDGKLIKMYKTRNELKIDGFNPKAIDNVIAGRSKTHKQLLFKTL